MRLWQTKSDNSAPATTGILTSAEDNARGNELNNAVLSAGMTLDGTSGPDTHVDMLAEAIARLTSLTMWGQDTGAANAYVIDPLGSSVVVPRAYFNGMMVSFTPTYANSGASTANVFGLGTKSIYLWDGPALSGGEMAPSHPVTFQYQTFRNSGAGGFAILPWTLVTSTPTREDFYAVDSGAANAIVASFVPTPANLASLVGKLLRVKLAHSITAASTIDINAFGAVTIVRPDGHGTQAGDAHAGEIAVFTYDGANVQLVQAPNNIGNAQKSTAFTATALTSISGAFTDNVAQTLNITGATYIDADFGCSVFYNNTSGSPDNVSCTLRLYAGSTLIDAGDMIMGAIITPTTASPLGGRQIFQGLNSGTTYTLKLTVQQNNPATGPMVVSNASIVALFG